MGEFNRLLKKTDPEGHVTNIEYKPKQLVVTKVTEPGGGVRTFDYDFKGYTFYSTDTRGNVTVYKANMDGKMTLTTKNGRIIKKIDYQADRTQVITDESGNTTRIQTNEKEDPIRIIDGEGHETRIEYNQYWKVAKITDPLGNVTTFNYDEKENLTVVTDPAGQKTLFDYDRYGNAVKMTKGQGAEAAVTSYEYDGRGNVAKLTDPLGNVTILGYDAYGHLNKFTDPSGNVTTVTNDLIGRPLAVENPLGGKKSITWDKKGNVTSVTDELNRTTSFTYDFKGRVTSAIDPQGNKTVFAYDGEGNLTEKRELAGTADETITSFTYDFLNRLESVTDPLGNVARYEYAGTTGCTTCSGSAAIPVKITDPLGNVTQNIFNKAGSITGVKDPLGNVTSLLRDALGRVTSQTDANGNTSTYTFDTLGRIAKQTDANGGETRFGYDSRGNLTSLTDPNGNTTRFEYDLAGRKTKEIRPRGQVAEYGYYPNGLLKTVKDAKNQTTTYAYDNANRLAEVLYADGKKDTFGYDAVGNMTSYAKEGVSGTITYDELNRKTSETVNYGTFSKTFSYSYDNKGNKASFTTPDGKVYSYSYNKNSQPTAMGFDGKTIQLDYQWDRLTKQTLPNGVATDYQYNAASWLAAITTKNTTTTLASSQYGFDKVGNITGKTTEQGNHSFGYDPTYQLSSATHPTLPAEAYSYDKTGNRTNSGYSHNANNELTAGNNTIFTHDPNGNTTQKKVGEEITGYTYNSADRLESVQLPDGRIATYTYDPFGRRIRKDVAGEVTYYVYADEGLIGEYDAQGNQQKGYGWKPDGLWGTDPVFMAEDGNYYFYQNDHLGTPQKLVDESGNIVWSAEYSAFGQAAVDPASTVDNNLRFPGQYWDEESGLHYNWNRYYDPGAGRYISVDPIGFLSGDPNFYRYVENTTNNYTDSLGLYTESGGLYYDDNGNIIGEKGLEEPLIDPIDLIPIAVAARGAKLFLTTLNTGVRGYLANRALRQSYNATAKSIKILNKKLAKDGVCAKGRAEIASGIRHEARMGTRGNMKNADQVNKLRARDAAEYKGNPDGPDWNQLVEKYTQKLNDKYGPNGFTQNDVYEEIINAASRTDTWKNIQYLTW
ncbi:MAG: RHS repeat protein [Geobacter sp.]|nr:RHS repeat protein [Geobacter sp.]